MDYLPESPRKPGGKRATIKDQATRAPRKRVSGQSRVDLAAGKGPPLPDAEIQNPKKGRGRVGSKGNAGTPTISNRERVARNSYIVQRTAQGWKQDKIAEELGITQGAVSKILATAGRDLSFRFLDQDPVETVEWALARYHESLVMYDAAALDAASSGEYTAAVKGRDAATERIIRLYQAVGKLPRELGTLRHVIDFRGIGQEMVRVMRAVEAGEASVGEAVVFFERLVGLGAEGSDARSLAVEGSVSEEKEEKEDAA